VPKSRVRKKAVYTPPPRSVKLKTSGRGLPAVMVACLVVGLAWIAIFYISGQHLPASALGSWNLVVGFSLIVAGVILSTRWR
jgi:hypothetical protein